MVLARKLLCITLLGIGLSLSWLATTISVVSAFTEPGITGDWRDFANCPAEKIVLLPPALCEHSYTTSGVIRIGHSSVPISVPGDTLDLGVSSSSLGGVVVSPPHGILNGPAQPVPGGLLGTVGNSELTEISAKLEWAPPVAPGAFFGSAEGCSGTNPLVTFDSCRVISGASGTAVTLSVRIHLISPFLGTSCYIGSPTSPIVIALTMGVTSPPPPTHPIHGQALEFLKVLAGVGREQAINLTLVNNSFSVPVATGCGTSSGTLINSAINKKLGLPSPPGQNAIIINGTGEQALAAEVLGHGWTGE